MSETNDPQFRHHEEEKSKRVDNYDFVFKVVTALSLIFTAGWAIVQYSQKKGQELKEKNQEYQFTLYKERKEAIYPLCHASADIVSSVSLKDASIPIKTFETLYFGEVNIIANRDLDSAAQSFAAALLDYKNESGDAPPPVDLIVRQKNLAEKCKELLDLKKVFGMPSDK